MGIFNRELMLQFEESKNDIIYMQNTIKNMGIEQSKISNMINSHELDIAKLKNEYENIAIFFEYMDKESIQQLYGLLQDLRNGTSAIAFEEEHKYLSANEVAKELSIPLLNGTEFKYFLYLEGLLSMNFNQNSRRARASYKISDKYENIDHEFKQYIIIDSAANFSFNPEIIPLLHNYTEKIYDSLRKSQRRRAKYNESQKVLEKKLQCNYRIEINKICGIKDKYDKEKYKKLYEKYMQAVDHKSLFTDWNKYKEEVNDKITCLDYIVNELKHGDILLRLACELFVY